MQNVLQLRPNEARALQLLAEVDRQEQEYKKLRQEKEQLHRAAMDAWQKGDVSSALAKLGVVLELDRRAPDSINRESGANYQSFYNEVRSEHDAMNTAYAEARQKSGRAQFRQGDGGVPDLSGRSIRTTPFFRRSSTTLRSISGRNFRLLSLPWIARSKPNRIWTSA